MVLDPLLGKPPYASVLVAVVSAIAGLLYYIFGFEVKDPQTNTVAEIAGNYVNVVLNGGLIWWFPLIGALRKSVSVVRQTITVTVGVGGEEAVYSKDRAKVSFEIEIVLWVVDPFTWIAIYEEDPMKLVQAIFDRTLRWFAARFPAEVLVHMPLAMSEVIRGEKNVIWVDGVRHEMPEFDPQFVKNEIEETGAWIEDLYVKKVNVPKDLEEAWLGIARESVQVQTEMRDAQTGAEIAAIWRQAGLGPNEAANMAALVQGREAKKQILSLEGVREAAEGLATLLPAILGNGTKRRTRR